MNNYHRYLNLPFEIEPPEFFSQNGSTIKHQYINDYQCPQVNSFLESLNLYCRLVECFYTPPNSKIPIHTDHPSYTNHAKINVTWGPKEGVIQWWKSDKVTQHQFSGGEYTNERHSNLWAEEKDCTFLYEANTNRPSLVNVGILHGTNNPSNQGRWTLCFVPVTKNGNYIEWSDSLQIFKDYIEEER